MLFYEVKLINPQTKEIYFKSLNNKAILPPHDVLQKFKGAILIISTTNGCTEEKKKAA